MLRLSGHLIVGLVVLVAPLSLATSGPSDAVGAEDGTAEQKLCSGESKCQLQNWFDGMAEKARGAIKNKLHPEQDWFALIVRYHNWFSKYKGLHDARKRELEASSPGSQVSLMSPVDVFAVTYARVEGSFYNKLKQKEEKLTAVLNEMGEDDDDDGVGGQVDNQQRQFDPKSLENMDYLYKVLVKLISDLETVDLDDMRAVERELAGDQSKVEQVRATSEFKESMERARKIGLSTAKGFVQNEIMTVIKIAFVNALAVNLGHALGPTNEISQLSPLVLGAAPGWALATQYGTNLTSRTLRGLLGVLNPLERIKGGVGH